MRIKHITLTIKANNSAKITADQIPFTPNLAGIKNIIKFSNTIDLKNDITADINPLLRAVKSEDTNILNPLIKNDIENILIARAVIFSSSLS